MVVNFLESTIQILGFVFRSIVYLLYRQIYKISLFKNQKIKVSVLTIWSKLFAKICLPNRRETQSKVQQSSIKKLLLLQSWRRYSWWRFIDILLFLFLVEIPDKKLNQKLLDTKCVYILDCWSDVFIWWVLSLFSSVYVTAFLFKIFPKSFTWK